MDFEPVDETTRAQSAAIVTAVKERRDEALLEFATKFGDLPEGETRRGEPMRGWRGRAGLGPHQLASDPWRERDLPLRAAPRNAGSKALLDRDDLKAAWDSLTEDVQALLTRVAGRIRAFAEAQRASLTDVDVAVPGGRAGHEVAPVVVAGCYAPGGRYPLPSSVLMTAVTARAAGVTSVYVASPRPTVVTLAAAYVADADGLLAVGGAQVSGGSGSSGAPGIASKCG